MPCHLLFGGSGRSMIGLQASARESDVPNRRGDGDLPVVRGLDANAEDTVRQNQAARTFTRILDIS